MHNISDHLKTGMPELSIPPLEPLSLGESELLNIEGMKVIAYNSTMWGLWDFKINDLKLNFEDKFLWINVTFPTSRVETRFKALVRIIQMAEQHGNGILDCGN